jgi:hypothetical protein
MDKIIPGVSNWEFIAFIILNHLATAKNHVISRSEIMTIQNLTLAEKITEAFGHKSNPKHPDKTLQRTLQNMRDKGYIDFLGVGEYRLTEKGAEIARVIGEKHPHDLYVRELNLKR